MAGLPGWYPDPGNAPGQYRYWDGQAWSELLSPTPYAPPPATAAGPAHLGPGAFGASSGATLGGTFGAAPATGAYRTGLPPKRKAPVGPIVIVAVLVVALGVAGAIIIPKLTGSPAGTETTEPLVEASPIIACPDPKSDTDTYQHPNDGWVHGGALAYPRLDKPWSLPLRDDRVPFGKDVREQSYMLHRSYGGGDMSWVASVHVAELNAGDGFFSPAEGAEIVTQCVLTTFYGDAVVTRHDTRNESYSIDGKDGWIIESTLSFHIENLPTTSEDITIIVSATSEFTSSLFYASVPNDSPESIKGDVRRIIDSLKVST
jgi:hypothetical protein